MKIKMQMNPEVSKTFEISTLMSVFSNIKIERSADGCELIMSPDGANLKALKERLKGTSSMENASDEMFGVVTTYLYLMDLGVAVSELMKELPIVYMMSRLQDMFDSETEAIEFLKKTVKVGATHGNVRG